MLKGVVEYLGRILGIFSRRIITFITICDINPIHSTCAVNILYALTLTIHMVSIGIISYNCDGSYNSPALLAFYWHHQSSNHHRVKIPRFIT